MSGEFEVNEAASGAAEYTFVQTSALKKGSHVLIKDQPCKIESISTSKPGKHGSAKCMIVAKNIFNGKRLETISQAHAQEKAPIVVRTQWNLDYIEDGYMTLHGDDNEVREDMAVPDNEMGVKIQEAIDAEHSLIVTLISSMGQDMVVSWDYNKDDSI